MHPGVDVVGAAAHLVEAGRIEGALMQRLADDGVETDLVVLLPVVEPVLGPSVLLDHHPRRLSANAPALAPRTCWWFDEVVVDRDQRHVPGLAGRFW